MSADPGAFEVALCQYEFESVESVDALIRRVEGLFDRAGDADCYVLPELFASDCLPSGEGPATLGSARRTALHDALAAAADDREAVVVGGSYNVAEDGAVYNRCPVATPGGGVETYDKRHLVPEEREAGKRPGAARPPVVEHGGVGVGVAVCYDVEFPELVRDLADRGAEVVAVPSWTAGEAGFQRVRRCAAARAVENQLYVAHVSVVGERSADLRGTGRSAVYAPCDDVVGPRGTRLSLPRDEFAAGTCAVDVAALRRSRSDAAVRPYADAGRREE
ncbi:nitrilase-related carbon-nitrogen hydrolase [Halorussus sp. AFM4]|uniref:nitrilase-related carbon-nitrogen hydrolase n=1 Tax=Halorussus sp. AFM4 TaxID=3421651 RepID=UPI003EB91380